MSLATSGVHFSKKLIQRKTHEKREKFIQSGAPVMSERHEIKRLRSTGEDSDLKKNFLLKKKNKQKKKQKAGDI